MKRKLLKLKYNLMIRLFDDYLDLIEKKPVDEKLEYIRKLISLCVSWYE